MKTDSITVSDSMGKPEKPWVILRGKSQYGEISLKTTAFNKTVAASDSYLNFKDGTF